MMNRCSIYVLETNEKIRESLEIYIKSLEWLNFCGSSIDIEKSIDSILDIKPDILILNNILPMLSNSDNIEKIKKLNEKCNIYILSGRVDNNIILYLYKLGVKKYIKKPCDFVAMFDIIRSDVIKSELLR